MSNASLIRKRSWTPADALAKSWPDKYRDIDAIQVGDQSVAFGYPEGDIVLDWANGTVYGTVSGHDTADSSAVEDFALALDALLP